MTRKPTRPSTADYFTRTEGNMPLAPFRVEPQKRNTRAMRMKIMCQKCGALIHGRELKKHREACR